MSKTDQPLLRVVYFSHQTVGSGVDAMKPDIDQILATSRVNNMQAGITGALIFNAGIFGQVLEGPITAVEDTFERIQMDQRHHNVVILDTCRVTERSFPQWSMGFVGSDRVAAELYAGIGSETGFDITSLTGQEIVNTLRGLAIRNETLG